MGRSLVSGPTEEPITLEAAKLHLREDGSEQDALIQSLIVAVRRHAEEVTGRRLMTQDWKETLDRFPYCTSINRFAAIRLGLSPVQSVVSIRYTDSAGVDTLLSTDVYALRADRQPPEVALKFGQTWPATRDEPDAVRVTVRVGYGSEPSSVEDGIRTAMLIHLSAMYEQREGVITGTIVADNPLVEQLYGPYKVLAVA